MKEDKTATFSAISLGTPGATACPQLDASPAPRHDFSVLPAQQPTANGHEHRKSHGEPSLVGLKKKEWHGATIAIAKMRARKNSSPCACLLWTRAALQAFATGP
jgi:hypothetical protein